MAIFPNLELERELQENDKTRLDATKSYISKDEAAITLVEIEPEAAAGYVDVTGAGNSREWYLDYQYATDGTKTATVRVTTDGAPVSFSKTIEVLTEVDDRLFSDDQDIRSLEQDVLKFVPAGRNSFLNIHRKSQFLILQWFRDLGYKDVDGEYLDKDDVVDIEEVRKWSQYLTLRLIYEDLSNSVDDEFNRKAQWYAAQESEARDKSAIKLDRNNDGTLDNSDFFTIRTTDLIRR